MTVYLDANSHVPVIIVDRRWNESQVVAMPYVVFVFWEDRWTNGTLYSEEDVKHMDLHKVIYGPG